MNTLAILKAARAKIEKPENWTQGVFARNAHGLLTGPHFSDAACWCALGAVKAALPDHYTGYSKMRELLSAACPPGGDIVDFNDDLSTTHADILAMFDRAIAAEEAKAVQS